MAGEANPLALGIVRQIVAGQLHPFLPRAVTDNLLAKLVMQRHLLEPSREVERAGHGRLELAETDLTEEAPSAMGVPQD